MLKLPLLTWIGNAAAVLCGGYGDVTQQARDAGCSRQTAYDHADKVHQALADAQRPGPSRRQLLDDNARLRDENRQLWEWLDQTVDCTPEKQQQFTAAACALGLSLTQTLVLLAILLPRPRCPSRATLGRWVQQAAAAARRLLAVLDRGCRGLVQTLCLDEIFCRRVPLLMGVEPRSLAWVLGWRAPDRSGPTWCQALLLWSQLSYAAVDGGSGLRKGLELVQQRWQQDAPLFPGLPVDTNLDNFHIQREGQGALRREWQAAERLWERAEAADREVARVDRRGTKKTGPAQRALHAWEKACQAFHHAQRCEDAWQRAAAALEVFRPDGRLNDRAWASREIAAAVQALPGERWARACRMLSDERALTFLDRLGQELQQAERRAELRDALVRWWRLRQAARGRGGRRAAQVRLLLAVQERVCRTLAADWQASAERLGRVLEGTVRASSVVECMNSVVRMHQARHRTLTQGLLDLKRLYWNCRDFAEGKRRGQCPYELLGLRLPTYDAWALLQMDPQQVAQQLSTSKVAA
jgi:hypothetical protein